VSVQTVLDNAALGALPGWLVILLVVAFHVLLLFAFVRGRRRSDDDEVHV
jgi:uncharacterized membrane protein